MGLHIIFIAIQIILASGIFFSLNRTHCSSSNVRQTPSEIFVEMGQQSKIHCSHMIQNYNYILWYRQLKGSRQLQLLGYMSVNDGYPEKGVDVQIQGSALKDQTCDLTVKSNTESAKYFCAASSTVTERGLFQYHNITPPTVKIYPPSKKERPRKKGDTKLKTLVCVASGFYPDHVEVSWKVNEEPRKKRVSTDLIAQRSGTTYTISSRLVVDEDEWTDSNNCFTV
uniref:Ig-like domain-containing protein n=1 Tax=Neogobius melanostomus TaxID=47308 RepID=A0A8C6SX94_9GOBI